ncbi:MAG: LysM peptidoglycan-binding domain-containing protein [Gemmatimonadaceae bacterium]
MPVRVPSRHSDLVVIRAAALAALSFGTLAPRAMSAQQQPSTTMPATHTVKRGDTLWDISKLYLGDPFLWPEIYRLNTGAIEDPHWIYPGEVLKLPGAPARVVAVTPPTPPEVSAPPQTEGPRPITSVLRQPTAAAIPAQAAPAVGTTVRTGEYAAAPWVDDFGGPRGAGHIMEGRDLPGIATHDRTRLNLYDAVLVAPPVGAVAPEHELYLSYRFGPSIENFGQIIIPTGIIEITRSPRNGEAAIGRVVKMFGLVQANQLLIAYDSSAALVTGQPSRITNGRSGHVRWIAPDMPVLPRIQNYVVFDMARTDGVTTGDRVDLYEPRQKPREGETLALPEVWIASAQVLRVTPFGATAVITTQEQPKIEAGTAIRISAKMP